MKDARVLRGILEPVHAAAALEAEKEGGGHAQQFLAGEAAQQLGNRVDVQELVRVGIKKKEGVTGFLEKRLPQVRKFLWFHGNVRRRPCGRGRLFVMQVLS